METRWEYLTPPEFKKLTSEHKTCILPVGVLERHGDHLPYGTDGLSIYAITLAASRLEPCVVFPIYWFSQVHEAACFTGAINFPMAMCLQMLETLLDQIAHNGFDKILIVNGHGGNGPFLDYFAVSQLDRKVNYTLYITDGWRGAQVVALKGIWESDGGGHACERETSMMMAINPESVKMEYQRFQEPINPNTDLSHLNGVRTALDWYAMYPEQVAGSPSKATPEKGQKYFDACVTQVAERIKAVKADTVMPMLQKEFYARCGQVPLGQ